MASGRHGLGRGDLRFRLRDERHRL
jgi:hypothetical protein